MIYQALPVPKERIRGDEEGFAEDCALPESVSSYLHRVRAEAQRIPDIMVAAVPPKYESSEEEKLEKVYSQQGLCPPTEWETSVLADFSQVRHVLSIYHARGVGSKKDRRFTVPPMRDACAWATFCFGPSRARQLEDDYSEIDLKFSQLPSTRLVLQFDSPMTQAVLRHHIKWADKSVHSDQALWLYALLARLELPLHRDLDCLLRTLVLSLLRHRSTAPPEDLPCLQLLLLLAGKYFGQATPTELDGTEPYIGPTVLPSFGDTSATAFDDEDDADPSQDTQASFSEGDVDETAEAAADFDWVETQVETQPQREDDNVLL